MGQAVSHADACGLLEHELHIEKPYSVPEVEKNADVLQRIICLVQQDWLASQINSKVDVFPHKHLGKSLSMEEKTTLLQPSHEYHYNGWQRVNVIVIRKPLRELKRKQIGADDLENSSLSDFLSEVLKEDQLYMKKIINERFHEIGKEPNEKTEYLNEESFKDLVEQIYGVSIKKLIQETTSSPTFTHAKNGLIGMSNDSTSSTTLLHLAPVILAVETDKCFYIFEDTPQHTLYDVLAFSPAIVANSAAKFLFILYQILRCFSTFRSKGFSLSPSLSFKDLFISNSMWISVSGFHVNSCDVKPDEKGAIVRLIDRWRSEPPPILTPPFTCTNPLQDYTAMWINNDLSNFDYIMILNTLADRRMKDPSHYPIFPWVIDFTKPNGGFRDMTKSKYRLCKSDAQLDITFRHLPTRQSRKDIVAHIPHHISDHPLTIISYYVYLARKTPKDVLCKNVRSRWVPDEYPSSMERMYQWTPEECIPEFYSDPSIFTSLHSDLPDLKLPSWASSPEDFIAQHRNILEGNYVSLNLNHWIDLVFGYKLFGTAAIESKNVYLSIVDGHNHVTNCGVLQLFSRPHPSRKIPTELTSQLSSLDHQPDWQEDCYVTMNGFSTDVITEDPATDDFSCVNGRLLEDDVSNKKQVAIRRDIWSIESAIDEAGQMADTYRPDDNETEAPVKQSLPAVLKHRFDSLLEGAGSEAKSPALEEIKINFAGPMQFIEDLENLEKELKFEVQLAPPNKGGIGKHEFGSVFDDVDKAGKVWKIRLQDSADTSSTDIQVLVSLVIELVLHDQSRLRTRRLDLGERMKENIRLLKSNLYRFPSWLVVILDSLLDNTEQDRLSKNDEDLEMTKYMKTPSMLLNQCVNPFSLPVYFPVLHDVLVTLYAVDSPHFSLSASMSKSTVSVSRMNHVISENNIIRASQLLPGLLDDLDNEGIDLILTFILPLFSDTSTKLAAFLHMFHPLGNVLGCQKSLTAFYHDLQKLYDHCNESDSDESKLLDHGFISKVITVFGLSFFLDRFMPFVIEGLVERVESSSFKEKNEAESFEQLSDGPPGKLSDGTENAIENEFLQGENVASQATYSSDFEKESVSTSANRGKFESFLEEEEDGVNLFAPNALDGRKLVRSGVFTRLESILEDEHVKREQFSEIIEEDEELSREADKRIDFSLGQEDSNDDAPSNQFDAVGDVVDGDRKASISADVDYEATRCERSSSDNSDDVFSRKSFVKKVKEGISMKIKRIASDSIGLHDNEASSPHNDDSMSDPLSRFADIENNTSIDLSDSNRGHKNSAEDDGVEIEEDQTAYSIDSMSTEDDFKSFLIRRSAIRSRRKGDQSPFMIVPSDDETSSPVAAEDDSPVEIAVDKLPETDALEEIEKIPSSVSSKSFQQDMSAQDLSLSSLRWIVPWLGPALTTRHVVNAILKKLPRIWMNVRNTELTNDDLIETLASKRKHLIECLVDVVRVYGSALVVHQFIPYAVNAVEVAVSATTVSAFAEGQLVTSTEILFKTLSLLSADVLFGQTEILSQQFFEPLLRLLSSLKKFNSGAKVRSILLQSLVDLLASLSKILGQIDAREVMTPLLQRFFSCFDCIYRLDKKQANNSVVLRKFSFLDDYSDADISTGSINVDDSMDGSLLRATDDHLVAINDSSFYDLEGALGDNELSISDARINENLATLGENTNDNDHLAKLVNESDELSCARSKEWTKEREEGILYKDLYESFKPSLAYYSYVLFCRVLGDHFMGSILYNEDLIWQLCSNHDEGLTLTSSNDVLINESSNKATEAAQGYSKDIEPEDVERATSKLPKRGRTISEHEEEEIVFKSTWQHLGGEWLEQWKDNFESKNDDGKFVFNGRRLQTYAGHLSAVRDIYVPDNEHYFLSASRDKTVKLWLLKNHGNGTAQLGCSKTYDKHTKSVFAIQAIESKRLAVSCDGSVHFWDPIKCSLVSQVELGKNSSVLSIRTLPVPHSTVAMATTEGTIKMYDVRQKVLSQEWKLVSSSAAGTVKCLCVNESGTWIAAGFSSGFISVLDLRTGILRGQWRAHESEVLQIEPYNEHNFLSSSADLRLKMWNEDGSLALRFRSPPEPIPCLSMCRDQCIWATATGNKVGITQSVENWAGYTCKKLPQDLFKGTISNLTILPVNQMYLVGSENGNVTLFA